METNISNKTMAVIMAAITSFMEEESCQVISLNEKRNSGKWVSASRESLMMKRVMMQMRSCGR